MKNEEATRRSGSRHGSCRGVCPTSERCAHRFPRAEHPPSEAWINRPSPGETSLGWWSINKTESIAARGDTIARPGWFGNDPADVDPGAGTAIPTPDWQAQRAVHQATDIPVHVLTGMSCWRIARQQRNEALPRSASPPDPLLTRKGKQDVEPAMIS